MLGGYGAPLIITLLTCIFQFYRPKCSIVNPRIGEYHCFFPSQWIYQSIYCLPVTIHSALKYEEMCDSKKSWSLPQSNFFLMKLCTHFVISQYFPFLEPSLWSELILQDRFNFLRYFICLGASFAKGLWFYLPIGIALSINACAFIFTVMKICSMDKKQREINIRSGKRNEGMERSIIFN